MKKILLFFITALSINVNAQWVLQTSGTTNTLQDIYFPNANTGYTCDALGYTRQTTNGGVNWNVVGAGNLAYGALTFTSVDTGYAGGQGTLLKTTDGGLSWNVSHTPGGSSYFLNSNLGFFCTTSSLFDTTKVYKTTNAGTTWNKISSIATPGGTPLKIFFISSTIGFMVVDQNGIYKTIDGGITWIPKLVPDQFYSFQSVFFPSASTGYLIGMYDSIYKSTDTGETWHVLNNTNSLPFYSLYFIDNNTGYVVGGDGISQGGILKTVNGGNTWTVDLSIVQTLWGVNFPTSTLGYACGSGGVIYKLDLTTGVNEETEDNGINVYPNPASNELGLSLRLRSSTNELGIKEVHIYNLLREVVMSCPSASLRVQKNRSETTIDISNLSKGVYFVEVQTTSAPLNSGTSAPLSEQIIRKKFVKE